MPDGTAPDGTKRHVSMQETMVAIATPSKTGILTLAAVVRPAHRLLLLALLTGFALALTGPVNARGAPDSFADLAEELLPAVVNISTTQVVERRAPQGEIPFPPGSPYEEFFRDFFERQRPENMPEQRATSLGSGFIIDSSGYVVTNNHVIADAEEIRVILHDDTSLEATLVGRDPKTDIALLKVETDKPLPTLKWGDSDGTRVGDWVLAIGNPFGLGGTVTAGIVSARARDINAGPYDDFIQTDASINRGNSGGPMFNLKGEVIGVNTAIFSPSGGNIGIGFAVPSTLAKPVVDQLREHGRTRRGWLGVRIQGVTEEIAESLGLDRPIGALVAAVTPGGPAEKAGVQAGDVIIEFEDETVEEMRRLPRMVAETDVGTPADVTVWRDGKKVDLKVKLGELEKFEESDLAAAEQPAPSGATSETEVLGLALTTISPEARARFQLSAETKGVLIADVAVNSPAAEKGLRPGDVIVEVGQEEAASTADVQARIQAAKDNKRKSVLFLIERRRDLRFVALRVDGEN